VPPGVTRILVEAWGAGGGGGGGSYNGNAPDGTFVGKYFISGGGGGGAGGYARTVVEVAGLRRLGVVVGTGGAGGAEDRAGVGGQDGTDGGETRLLIGSGFYLVAEGGRHGLGGIAQNVPSAVANLGGAGGNGDFTASIKRKGGDGGNTDEMVACCPALNINGLAGGVGGVPPILSADPRVGQGGNGGTATNNAITPATVASPGRSGGDGYVLITW
jgi:hypothetical protein